MFVKCNSHRARKRLFGVIGQQKGFWSPSVSSFHGVYQVPTELIERARRLKGITKARNQDPDFWHHCW